MKMDRLTIKQHLKIIKTNYKNGNSVTATYRALRGDYGLHSRPTMQAIGKIVQKFGESRVITNIESPNHHSFASSDENIAIISESAAED